MHFKNLLLIFISFSASFNHVSHKVLFKIRSKRICYRIIQLQKATLWCFLFFSWKIQDCSCRLVEWHHRYGTILSTLTKIIFQHTSNKYIFTAPNRTCLVLFLSFVCHCIIFTFSTQQLDIPCEAQYIATFSRKLIRIYWRVKCCSTITE